MQLVGREWQLKKKTLTQKQTDFYQYVWLNMMLLVSASQNSRGQFLYRLKQNHK